MLTNRAENDRGRMNSNWQRVVKGQILCFAAPPRGARRRFRSRSPIMARHRTTSAGRTIFSIERQAVVEDLLPLVLAILVQTRVCQVSRGQGKPPFTHM